MAIFTAGYAGKTLDQFIDSLKKNSVNALADVRSLPYSKMFPDFNREDFAHSLSEHGIRYVYLGKELGPRSPDPNMYFDGGRVDFNKLMGTDNFLSGIDRLLTGDKRGFSIAMMCAEKDPSTCHRSLLVGHYLLTKMNLDINHILFDSSLISHSKMLQEIARGHGEFPDMFKSEAEAIENGYSKQCIKFAYTKPSESSLSM